MDAVLVTQFIWYGLVLRAKVLEKVIVERIEGVSISGHDNSGDDDDRRPPQGGASLKQKGTGDSEQAPPRRNKIPSLAHTIFITVSLLSALAGAFPVDDRQVSALPTGLPSLGDVPDRFISHDTIEMIGFIVGWSSTILYVLCTSVLSRLPLTPSHIVDTCAPASRNSSLMRNGDLPKACHSPYSSPPSPETYSTPPACS